MIIELNNEYFDLSNIVYVSDIKGLYDNEPVNTILDRLAKEKSVGRRDGSYKFIIRTSNTTFLFISEAESHSTNPDKYNRQCRWFDYYENGIESINATISALEICKSSIIENWIEYKKTKETNVVHISSAVKIVI